MKGCVPKFLKYTLFVTNFIIFVVGLVTLGFGIWVVVDKPNFLKLFNDAESVMGQEGAFDIGLYASAPYILIVVAVIVVIISFFGCFGAVKESRCMLITYFIIVLAIFIACIVGAVLLLQGTLEDQIKKPLLAAVGKYQDNPADSDTIYVSYKKMWNEVQQELKCCGVDSVSDWAQITVWDVEGTNKPRGCCIQSRGKPEDNTEEQITVCRKAAFAETDKYYFEGCFTSIEKEILSQQDKIFGAAIGTVVIMFINMVFAFALCAMAD